MTEYNDDQDGAAFMEASQRGANLATDFGFCAYGDAPPAIGGGMPWFYWFDKKEEMIATIRAHGLFLNPPSSRLDLEATQLSIERIVDSTDLADLEPLRSALNEQLRGASQFTWMGSFKDLCEGDHPKAQEVRTRFRECSADLDEDSADVHGTANVAGPIKPDERDAFKDFLSSYGI